MARGRKQLAEYRRKRDFRRTPEPEPGGDGARGRGRGRRGGLEFVIQKHAANQLHFDLRLELDGVMKSWAVPKGPSADPKVRRLAMQVEDHPMEYNAFEGIIPAGEYGGGTVMIWDRGTYEVDEAKAGDDAKVLRAELRRGKLSITVHGERMRGSWALIRTRDGPKPQWLLLKHRDEWADAEGDLVTDHDTSVVTGRTLEEIALDTDAVWDSDRARIGPKRTAKERPGIEPMRIRRARSLPDGDDYVFEPWHGGTRVLAFATAESAVLTTERGADVTRRFSSIAESLASLARRTGRGFVIDGEVSDGVFYAFDLLVERGRALTDRPWRSRRDRLEALFRRRRVPGVRLTPVRKDGARLLTRVRDGTGAGVVAKQAGGTYGVGEWIVVR
jgi:bifunctional non-homologous end joining protein LigD